jgi:hypothetical protein
MESETSSNEFKSSLGDEMLTSELRDNDILLGRGTGPNEHNKFFRSLVAMNRGKYRAAKTRKERAAVIMETALLVKTSNGRFLKKIKMKGGKHRFVVVNDMAIIRDKTKQAFRYSLEGSKIKKQPPNKIDEAELSIMAAKKEATSLTKLAPLDRMPSLIRSHLTLPPISTAATAAARFSALQLPPQADDHSALALLAEQALAERVQYEMRSALMVMQLRQALRMQETESAGFLLRSPYSSGVRPVGPTGPSSTALEQASLFSSRFPASMFGNTAGVAGIPQPKASDFLRYLQVLQTQPNL